jgi:hypothetical protein
MTRWFPAIACWCAACSASAADPAEGPSTHFCNLKVFTEASGKRHVELTAKVVAAVRERRELDAGYEFVFPGELAELGEWLDGDRRCCPTLHYDLELTPMQGPARLRITGNQAKPFIREEFARLFGDKR